MKLTQVLCRQHIGRHFKKHWIVQGQRKPIITPAMQVLKDKGIPVFEPEDFLREKREFQKIDVVGCKPKPVKFDETHPNWHDEPLLSFKDHNVPLEGLKQAQVITKTVVPPGGIPQQIEIKSLEKELHRNVKRIIMGAHVFDAEQVKLPTKIKDPNRPAYNFPRIYGISENRINKLMISKLLNLLETTQNYDLIKERSLLNDLLFSFPFQSGGDLVQFELKGETVLTSKTPLPPLKISDVDSLELPNLYPIKQTNALTEEHIYETKNVYPINQSTKKRYPHTLFIHYNKSEVKNLFEEEISEEQIFGRSLLKTFTAAASFARQNYGDDVQQLPDPITVQCVQTDGRLFHFGVLQLNTLDLENLEGKKNVWCQTDLIPIFSKCCYESGKPTLEDYNRQVVEHLAAFYNNH